MPRRRSSAAELRTAQWRRKSRSGPARALGGGEAVAAGLRPPSPPLILLRNSARAMPAGAARQACHGVRKPESGGKAMQYRRISADCHLDLPWLPPDLFTSQARREFKDRMPYVVDGPDGPRWTTKAGINMGLVCGVGSTGAKFVPGQNYRVDKMAETGLYEDGRRGVRRPGDPEQRLKDMDRDGVDAEIIFGILGVAARVEDPEAANEMLRIYNDWLKDFCSHYPERQIGLACLPYGDIDAAVTEVYRVAKLGLKGLELSCSWDMEPMWHPVWEPLWRAVSDVQLPLHFHTFPAIPVKLRDRLVGPMRRAAHFTSVAGFQMNLVNIISALIGAGVLEGYPHPDGVWPESSRYIAEQFAELPPEVVHKITCENAGRFYGLIN